MRPVLDRRAQRVLRRLPVTTVYSALELLLLGLLAVQVARLIYAIVTPVGPVGDWRPTPPAAPASPAVLGTFDPFFRLSDSAGPVVVTSLNLKLFGVRSDQASGRGSAIIGLPDGTQASFAVGEEIVSGVTLKAVAFDNVTIARGGTEEQIFLDQSSPATTVAPGPASAITAAPPPPLAGQIQAIPRMEAGAVDGVIIQPTGSGDAFRAAGLQPGDVVVAVNGTRITSADSARALGQSLAGGAAATIEVERGGRNVTLTIPGAR